jgi:hypothetical protein
MRKNITCSKGGKYLLLDSNWYFCDYSFEYLKLDEIDQNKLIYYMHNIKIKNEILELNIKKIRQIIEVTELPSVDEQIESLLKHIGDINNIFGIEIQFKLSDFLHSIGAINIDSLNCILIELEKDKLIDIRAYSSSSSEATVILTRPGIKRYNEIIRIKKNPILMISNYLKDFLTKGDLHQKYPKAFKKWIETDELLWMKKDDDNTTIGHKCRECLQEFASELIVKLKIENADNDIKHVKNRLKSVLNDCIVGKTLPKFIERFYNYIDIVNDLVQKQEHDASKENVNLTWNDSRRVVFHTALIMLEVDSIINNSDKF